MQYRKVERLVKAVANHRRIQILDLLERETNLSVIEIAQLTRANMKTIDVHLNRLFAVGMVTKRTAGTRVLHTITVFGLTMLKFLRKLDKRQI